MSIVTVAGGSGKCSQFLFPIPMFDRRRIESQVMIPNGNTLVMGGLVQDSPTASLQQGAVSRRHSRLGLGL